MTPKEEKELLDGVKFIKTVAAAFCVSLIFIGFLTAITNIPGCGPVIHNIIDPNAGSISDCQAACNNMATHQCPGWKGYPGEDQIYNTEDDISCEEICEHVTLAGVGLEQACVSTADSCEAMDRCQNS